MTELIQVLSVGGLLLALCGVLHWWLLIRPLRAEKQRRRRPFTQGLQRGPGESSHAKLVDYDDKISEYAALLSITLGVVFGMLAGRILPHAPIKGFAVTMSTFLLVVTLWAVSRMRVILRERRNYALGFEGERHTAQALQSLLAAGYTLYHDIPFVGPDGKPFNIDHVLVGPAGVFVIETKAKSKRSEAKGADAVKVRYDGKTLAFPDGSYAWGLDQTRANAKHLAKELTRHTGEGVHVTGVLSLPGWYIEQTVPRVDPMALNSLRLPKWIQSLPPVNLHPAQLNRIRGYLEKAAELPAES